MAVNGINIECLWQPGTCSPEELSRSVDGLYSYASIVYGLQDVPFASQLSPERREEVERVFGKYQLGADPTTYLSEARRIFFGATPFLRSLDGSCERNRDKFALIDRSNTAYGRGVGIVGVHGCGADHDKLFRNIEPELMQNPGDWIVFTEGEALPFQEHIMLARVGKALGVPVRNVFVTDTDPRILEGLKRDHGITPEQYAGYMAWLEFSVVLTEGQARGRRVDEATERDRIVHQWSSDLNLQSDKVMDEFNIYHRGAGLWGWTCEKLGGRGFEKLFNSMTNARTDVLNKLVADRAKEVLTQTGKRKALYLMGFKHAPVLDLVYP